jgi:RNA polymerase sigma-54 factor
MAIEMRQQMKLTQQLVMTPQLQQAIKLLQLSRLELQDVIRQEVEENPVLDESLETEDLPDIDHLEALEREPVQEGEGETFHEVEAGEETFSTVDWESYLEGYTYTAGEQYSEDEDRPSYENTLVKKGTLFDHLTWQVSMARFDDFERHIADQIVGNIDDDGYLRASVEELAAACSVDELAVERVLARVQEFDPLGVGGRDLRECLLIQIRQMDMGGTIVEAILLGYIKDLEARRYKQIAKATGVDPETVAAAAKIIAGLDPRPGRSWGQEDVQYITPDIYVYKSGDEYVVYLNDDGLPQIRINPYYASEVRGRQMDPKAEEYLNDKMRSALWLIKSIQQRQRTILKVSRSIVRFQRDFLERGIGYLRPLVLRDVAEDIGMHESTVSRVTTSKYMQTPQGLFELKFFFNSGISTTGGDFVASESVKNKIREIVEAEDARKPYSDQRLAELLAESSITIARRTVTKYREVMRIGSSSERKRHY